MAHVLNHDVIFGMGKVMLWNNLSIRTRILGGFGLVLALLLALALTAVLSFGTTGSNVGVYVEKMDVRGISRQIDRDVLVLRRQARTFAILGKPEDAKDAKATADKTRADIALARQKIKNPERLQHLGTASELFEGYMANFDKVIALKDDERGLVADVLDPTGAQVTEMLSKINSGAIKSGRPELIRATSAASEHALLVRLAVNQLLGRRDAVYADKAKKEFTTLDLLMSALDKDTDGSELEKPVDEAVALLPKYRDAANRLVDNAAQTDNVVNVLMVGQMSKFVEELDAISASAVRDAKEVEQNTIATISSTSTTMIVLSVVALVLGVGLALVLGGAISRPLTRMTQAMAALAGGDKTVEIPARGQKDEIGHMAEAVQVFKDNAIRMEAMRVEQEEQKRRAEVERQAALRQMADSFESQVGGVVNAVTAAAVQLQASSKQMAATAHETSAQATTVSAAAEEASANVQTVASATEELSSSINEIASQVERSQEVSVRANSEASHTQQLIEKLSENVGSIGEIVALINDIASQTNLLALNATIEAARAGDAGKGFAVVASEVKNLANQTGRATDEIASKISAVQSGTNDAVAAISAISTVITEVSEISSGVASAVQEQTAATSEIARNVDQASAGTQEVSQNIGQVEQAARDTGNAAQQINDSATELSHQADVLKMEVRRFLDQVRSDKSEIKLFAWDDKLNTGIPQVDGHHREMFDEMNRFFAQLMHGEGQEAVKGAMHMIENGMREHFKEEEDAMQRLGFDGLARHRASHQAYFNRYESLKHQVLQGTSEAPAELFEYTAKWFRDHIANEDIPFARLMMDRK